MGQIRRLIDWGRGSCIPLWLASSQAETGAAFVEALDLEGRPRVDLPRRMRVQARQIYVLCALTRAGWGDYRERAAAAMDRLVQQAYGAGGLPGWPHRFAPDGEIIDAKRDLYDHAFTLLALASLYDVTGEIRYRERADETLAFLDQDWSSDHGGYRESIGGAQTPRRQNPHMHLFEALIALYDATGDAQYLARLEAIYALFNRVFFDAETGVVREFFAEDWSHLDDGRSDICEPGHGCEWVWLLAQYDRLTGADTTAQAGALYATAMRVGVSSQTGLLHTSMTAGGAVRDAGSRSWMQTEWIRAAAVMARRGYMPAMDDLERCIEASFRYHFDPAIAGGWIDQVDADGKGIGEVMPTSTLYHVIGAFFEAEKIQELC